MTNMNKKFLGIVFYFLTHTSFVESKFLILGLFSLCEDRQNKSELNLMANKTKELIDKGLKGSENIEYISQDTCDEINLVQTFTDLILSDDFVSANNVKNS